MATPVSLGNFDFPSKTVAKDYVSTEILHKYRIGEPITDAAHQAVLADLLRRKQSASEKIGSGIEFFYVDYTKKFRSYVSASALTLVVRRRGYPEEVDVDFGYSRVIDDAGHVDRVKNALRYAAEGLRDRFKFAQFTSNETVYDHAGEPMTHHSQAEVRYEGPSWGELTYAFAQSQGGWDAIKVTSGDGEPLIGPRLAEDPVRVEWLAFFEANAHPILVKKRSV